MADGLVTVPRMIRQEMNGEEYLWVEMEANGFIAFKSPDGTFPTLVEIDELRNSVDHGRTKLMRMHLRLFKQHEKDWPYEIEHPWHPKLIGSISPRGYKIRSAGPDGEVLYTAGNNPHESTDVLDPDDRDAIPLERIAEMCDSTGHEMAAEMGRIYIGHDDYEEDPDAE